MRKSKTKDIKRIEEVLLYDYLAAMREDAHQLKIAEIKNVGTFQHGKQGYIQRYNAMCDRLAKVSAEVLEKNDALLARLCVVYNQLRRPWVGKLGLELNKLSRMVDGVLNTQVNGYDASQDSDSPRTVSAVV